MEELAGARGNWHQGVFFTEGVVQAGAHPRGRIQVEISRQNSNLTEVKNEMARQATATNQFRSMPWWITRSSSACDTTLPRSQVRFQGR